MNEKSELTDILWALTKDVAEAALYLRELGVERIEGVTLVEPSPADIEAQSSLPPPRARAPQPWPGSPPRAPALVRHANTEGTARNPLPKLPATSPRAGGAVLTTNEPTEMAKKTIRRPSANPPAPRETLFGEITPQDDLSLARPGETMEDIRQDIGECVRCPLHEGRTKIVHSEGNLQARLMFVGEAPGADEDAQGRPFVGRAGQLLNKIIEAIGLKREDVLIGNVNRCRPPQNRTPTHEEATTCKPFLLREINVVRPAVVVVLGNTAMKNLLDTKEGISKVRGTFQDYNGIKVMPTFHPAYLLRDPSKKRETWDDMKKVRDYLNTLPS